MRSAAFLRLVLLFAVAAPSGAATYYVDAARGEDARGRGTSWATAFRTIQAAVDAAKAGSTVLVTNGVYAAFSSHNKKLSIRSVEGASATAIEGVEMTIGDVVYRDPAPLCDLGRRGRAKIYDWDERGNKVWKGLYDEDAMLGGTAPTVEGFTLRNAANGAWGGSLSHCVLSNLTQNAVWATVLSDSVVADNAHENVFWFREGDGALVRSATLNRCRVVRNAVVQGIWGSVLLDTLVAENRQAWDVDVDEDGWLNPAETPDACRGDLVEGGALYNCTVAGNVLKEHELFRPVVVGSTAFGPIIEYRATGDLSNGVAIAAADCFNCIVWSNRADRTGASADFARMEKRTVKTTLSATDPLFRDSAGGDWRILPWSPCRDAGADWTRKTGKFDIDGRPRKIGGAVDLGAFEHPQGVPVQADWDGDGRTDPAAYCPDTFEWCVWESSTGDVRVETFGEKGAVPVPADPDGAGRLRPGYYAATAAKPAFVLRGADDRPVVLELGAKASTPLVLRVEGSPAPVLAAWSGTAKKPAFVFSDGRPALAFGSKGGAALAADFDGDGSSDLAVYASNASKPAFSVLSSRNGFSDKALFPAGTPVPLGAKGSAPAVGNWDKDKMVDFGVYEGSSRTPAFLRICSGSRWREKRSLPLGEKGSVPAVGDWDGDGLADPGVAKGGLWTWVNGLFDTHEFFF